MAKRQPPKTPEPENDQRERERRAFVEALASRGMPPDALALILVPPLSVAELTARYGKELEIGAAKGKAQVVDWVWESATKGNAAARMFLAKVLVGLGDTPRDPVPKTRPEEAPEDLPAAGQSDLETSILQFPVGPRSGR